MGQPYVGEIRMFAGNFAPAGWAFCQGQLLPISENDALFTLIGTTYGGDGEETFALPNLQSRVPIHQGSGPGLSNYNIGETGGVEEVTLTTQQIPTHNHIFLATGVNASITAPANALPATVPIFGVRAYGTDAPTTTLNPNAVSPVGGSQPHTNLQPYLCVSYIISLYGIYPNQS